jgi:hypothetical protein
VDARLEVGHQRSLAEADGGSGAAKMPFEILILCHELPRCLNRPPGPGLNNTVRNASCPAFLTVGKNQLGQRCFTPRIDNVPGGQVASGTRISKGHQERLVPLKAEASAGAFELICTQAQIKKNFRNISLEKNTIQMSKIGLDQRPLARASLEPLCRLLEGCGVFVKTNEPICRAKSLAQGSTVPAAAHRAIQDNIVRDKGKPFHYLVE